MNNYIFQHKSNCYFINSHTT